MKCGGCGRECGERLIAIYGDCYVAMPVNQNAAGWTETKAVHVEEDECVCFDCARKWGIITPRDFEPVESPWTWRPGPAPDDVLQWSFISRQVELAPALALELAMRARAAQARWSEALRAPECGGYYSEAPCRAKSCRLEDAWCTGHAQLAGDLQ